MEYFLLLRQHVLRHNLRPDDGPVQGPKHVVCLVIENTPPPY